MNRPIVWFSCGAASAIAAKLAVEKYGDWCHVVYCDTSAEEHPDNVRFMHDVESWIGKKVTIIKSEKYGTVTDVFRDRKYMSGIKGAPCTVELKKVPRFAFQRGDDIHMFGFTLDEGKRIEEFEHNNFDLSFDWILYNNKILKSDCYKRLQEANIELPAMYKLGYKNNNCIGCVKATSPAYWWRTMIDFPEHFERRAKQSREIGCRLTRVKGERIFLDELKNYEAEVLPLVAKFWANQEDISCGPECAPNT